MYFRTTEEIEEEGAPPPPASVAPPHSQVEAQSAATAMT